MTDIGYNIREMRKKLNYTQEYLAQKSGVSQPVFSRIEAGHSMPTEQEKELIAKTLHTTVKELEKPLPSGVHFSHNNIKGNGYVHQQNMGEINAKILEQLTAIATEMKANNDYLREENKELRQKDEKWMQMLSEMQTQLVVFLRERK